jgi:hypothetical protein
LSTPSELAESSEGLAWVDAEQILQKLGDELQNKQTILVGGQALNLWQSYFSDSDARLSDGPPMASKDIDFCGDARSARACATLLDGTALTPTPDDVNTPSTALVRFLDSTGKERVIDFVEFPFGLKLKRVRATALPVKLQPIDGPREVTLWVLHPVLCMFSRVHNTMGLPGYETSHALHQLAMSVRFARAFLMRLTDTRDSIRTFYRFAEEIYHFCHNTTAGREVLGRHGVDPFDAIPSDHLTLVPKFRDVRYPQMVDFVARRRKRAANGALRRPPEQAV